MLDEKPETVMKMKPEIIPDPSSGMNS